MNRILAVAVLLGITGCSYTQPYVTNISPAGKNGILVEKCKIQMNQLTAKISDSSCNTSYVWLGSEGGKNNSEEGSNPNNNVITMGGTLLFLAFSFWWAVFNKKIKTLFPILFKRALDFHLMKAKGRIG